MWLIIAMAATFSIAAGTWVRSIARDNVLEQHIRRLTLETDQFSSDLAQALAARVDAVRATGTLLSIRGSGAYDLRTMFAELSSAYPQLDWIAAADPTGLIVASNGGLREGDRLGTARWLSSGLQGPWLGVIEEAAHQGASGADATDIGDLVLPIYDGSTRIAGVIAVHVRWRRGAHHPQRLTDESGTPTVTQVCVLDRDELILIGPQALRGKRWPGVALGTSGALADLPQFEQMPDGRRVLVSRSALAAGDVIASRGWQVQLSEPNERVFQRANALGLRILWVSMGLGAVTAVFGSLGARHLTRRLRSLAASVAAAQDASSRIEVPSGVDEVAHLGEAFAKLLQELALERSELERRVAVRTREVEHLAEESRYAAIVRERLKMARDLHDTLAHSMMAIMSEIRFLRKLQTRDPAAMTKELARAERMAQEGLQEARSAITQMRATAARETGLGPALAEAFERFRNLTGLSGDFQADAGAARFGDERAETIVRMAQEVLRNAERHARATCVNMRLESINETVLELRIEDNGVGFDPKAIEPGHFGIVGLREQADLIGAQLHIESKPGSGTTVRVRLSLSPIAFDGSDTTLPV
jgi:signal transduction histidine kinase